MTNISEGQLKIDIAPAISGRADLTLDDSESAISKLMKVRGYSEKEIDDYAEHRGCSFAEACIVKLGISPREYAEMSRVIPEIIKPMVESETTSNPGVAVALGAAAVHLLDALKYYSKASSNDGLISAAVSGHPGVSHRYNSASSIEGLSASVAANRRKGAAEAKEASGYTEMIKAGYTPEEAQSYSNSAIESFVHTYVGPDNKNARAKLRKSLERYKK